MLVASLTIICLVLVYKIRRDKELLAESLEHYSELLAKLRQQLEQQKQLASQLAHDIKSPIAGIVASVESLQMLDSKSTANYTECLRLMRDSGRTNLRLVSNFIEFLSDRKKASSNQSLPDNRKELLAGLLSDEQLTDKFLNWKAAVKKVHVDLALRPFASAFAELCELAIKQASQEQDKKPGSVTIEEYLNKDSKVLVLRLLPFSLIMSPEVRAHYLLSLKVLERLGLRLVEANCSEQKGFIEIHLPLLTFSLPEENQTDKLVEAHLLVSWSTQQVDNAKLSVESLQQVLNDDKDQGSEIVEPKADVYGRNL